MHGGDIYRNTIKYDFSVNVNPLGISEKVKKAYIDSLNELVNYPDLECEALKKALAEQLNTQVGQLVCTNGASELIHVLCRYLKPKKAMLIAPGFSGYEAALQAVKSKIEYFVLEEKEEFLLTEMKQKQLIQKIKISKPELIFVTNPNNPNGGSIEINDLKEIVDICKRVGTFVCIDECFETLSNDTRSFIPELIHYPNAMCLRAFTKSFAMPGVRLGYGVFGDEKVAKELLAYLPEWNVSVVAQNMGLAALFDTEYMEHAKTIIEKERIYLGEELKKLGMKVYPTTANYILFFYDGQKDLYESLKTEGILIRDCSDYKELKKGFYRICIKEHTHNQYLVDKLHQVVNQNVR